MRITDKHVAIFTAAFDSVPLSFGARARAGLTAVAEAFADSTPTPEHRKELWIAQFLNQYGSRAAVEALGAHNLADTALSEFDKRFPS